MKNVKTGKTFYFFKTKSLGQHLLTLPIYITLVEFIWMKIFKFKFLVQKKKKKKLE